MTFEILFLFLSDSHKASAQAHARRNSTKSGAKPFKGTAALALLRDLTVALKLFQLGISPALLKDDRILTHFAVERSLETQAEQAVLGFWSWVSLELMAAALSKDRQLAKYDKLVYPSGCGPAPVLEGWEYEDRWDCDAAQTVVIGILASLCTKELLRSKIVAVRTRADGSVVVTGFCDRGKAGRWADMKPFVWFVDSHMGVTSTTHMWLESWALSRLDKDWVCPEYSWSGKKSRIRIGSPWWTQCADHVMATEVWNRFLRLKPVGLSAENRAAARSTPHSVQGCMAALARTLRAKLPHITILDRNRLGQWSANQLHSEAMLFAIGARECGSVTAAAIAGVARAPGSSRSRTSTSCPERYTKASAEEGEECALRQCISAAGRAWLMDQGVPWGEMLGTCVPAQLGQVPTMSFMLEAAPPARQEDGFSDDSLSEAESEPGRASWFFEGSNWLKSLKGMEEHWSSYTQNTDKVQ